jgi:hypothetical protein
MYFILLMNSTHEKLFPVCNTYISFKVRCRILIVSSFKDGLLIFNGVWFRRGYGGSTRLWNVGLYIPDYKMQHPEDGRLSF